MSILTKDIETAKKGCGKKKYCFICERYNCDCSSSVCHKTCGHRQRDGTILLCPTCQATLSQLEKDDKKFDKFVEEEIKFLIKYDATLKVHTPHYCPICDRIKVLRNLANGDEK